MTIEKKYKVCTRCGTKYLATLDFFTKDKEGKYGLHPKCKHCVSERRKKYYMENAERCCGYVKKYNDNHIEKIKAYNKKYHKEHNEKINARKRSYRIDNIDIVMTSEKKYRENNIEKRKEYSRSVSKEKYYNIRKDPKKFLTLTMGNAIRQALGRQKNGHHWESLVGYTLDDLSQHLEKQFKPGMTWENRGLWHIDHKIPITVFNYNKPKDLDFKRCWALSNLQPLWGSENMSKNAKIDEPFQPYLAFG